MLTIGSDTKQKSKFELVVHQRDNKGNSTGKTKSFTTDSAEELELLWNRNSGKSRKKRHKKTEAAQGEKEIKEALKETQTHFEKIRKARKLEE
jgi:hypothetical protein